MVALLVILWVDSKVSSTAERLDLSSVEKTAHLTVGSKVVSLASQWAGMKVVSLVVRSVHLKAGLMADMKAEN